MNPDVWFLDAVAGPDRGRRFSYRAPSITLGRAGTPDHDLQCPADALMSRQHADLLIEEGGVGITVRGEATPLRVGDAELREVHVPWGGTFEVGASTFRVDAAAALIPKPPRSLPRRRLEEFHRIEECGSGLSARVYKATDRVTGRTVALKVIRPEMRLIDPAVALFVREMDIHFALDHPNVVRPLHVGRDRGELFIGMEWVEGCDLEEYVAAFGTLTPVQVCTVGEGILDALAHAHDRGLIHRDIKPNNVMVPADGELVPRIVDFGMAKHFRRSLTAESLTGTGEARGSIYFSPPECLADAKRALPAADIFGVGATLYFLLTGAAWFDDRGDPEERMSSIWQVEMIPLRERNPAVPPALAAVIEGALQLDPARRWKTARQMGGMLHDVRVALEAEASA